MNIKILPTCKPDRLFIRTGPKRRIAAAEKMTLE
jgi:hypothetical protein